MRSEQGGRRRPLARRIDRLAGWVEIAPRQVLTALAELRSRRLTDREAREVERLVEHATQRRDTLDAAKVLFPVVAVEPRDGVEGGVVPVHADAFGAAGIPASTFLGDIGLTFEGRTALERTLGELGVPLRALRVDLGTRAESLDLSGGSCLAAHALAAAVASRGGGEFCVVSGGLSVRDGAVLLKKIGATKRKARVAALEAPNHRVVLVGAEEERVGFPDGSLLLDVLERLGVPGARSAIPAPRSARELKDLSNRAEYDYLDQDYPQARVQFEGVWAAVKRGGFDAILAAELAFRALTRLADIAIHDSRLDDASRLHDDSRQWLVRHPEVPMALRMGFVLGRADRLIDTLDVEGAEAELEQLDIDVQAATRVHSEEARRLVARYLGTSRRLALLRGRPDEALEHQRRMRSVLPIASEQPRILCDLGFVLARAGNEEEGLEVLERGLAEVGAVPILTYRLQTEAFLRYFRGRLRICHGERLDDVGRLQELQKALMNPAPRWRIEQVLALDALVAGEIDPTAGVAAVAAARPDERRSLVFARMMGVIALLIAMERRDDLREPVETQLRPLLDGLVEEVAWEPLAEALEGLRVLDSEAVRFVLGHRAY